MTSFSRVAGRQEQLVQRQSSLRVTGRQHQAASTVRKEVALPAGLPAVCESPALPPSGPEQTNAGDIAAALTTAQSAASLPEAPKPAAPNNSQPASGSELAFAARVRPDPAASATASDPQRPSQPDVTAPVQASQTKDTASDSDDPASKKSTGSDALPKAVTPLATGASAPPIAYAQSSEGQPSASLAAAPSVSRTLGPVETPQTQPKPAAAPVKDISLQVTQAGAQKVEIRLVQQSGELRVAVRTGDSDLAHGLQQGLSDLVGRLQESGYRAEAWRPDGTTVQSTPVGESRTSSGGSQNEDSRGHSSGSYQQEGEERQNQSQRPGWVEELDSSIASGEQSQGASYGIGS
jgi:hypothetical protein